MNLVQECIEPVYYKVCHDMFRAAKGHFGEKLTREDAETTIQTALWICRQNHPEVAKDELIREAVRYLYNEHCEYLRTAKIDRSLRKRRTRVAKELADKLSVTPWGEAFVAKEYDESEAQPHAVAAVAGDIDLEAEAYEEKVNQITVQDLLAKLLERIKDQDEAVLAWVLHRAYGYSIPTILGIYGITAESVGEQQFNANRKVYWERLWEVNQRVKELVPELGIDGLEQYFNA